MPRSFVETIIGLRHYLAANNLLPKDSEPPVTLTIEVPSPELAYRLLLRLKEEFGQFVATPFRIPSDYRQPMPPMRIAGIDVVVTIRDVQPLPRRYLENPLEAR